MMSCTIYVVLPQDIQHKVSVKYQIWDKLIPIVAPGTVHFIQTKWLCIFNQNTTVIDY